jgi:branched-chain amino acid transport system ATP-binding protein
VLELSSVSKNFGGLYAVMDLSFSVKKGEILGLIGPNGAGKTTVFNIIAGVYHPMSGTVSFFGKDVTKLTIEERCKLGIARTFQIVRIFSEMTCQENVLCGTIFGKKRKTDMKIAKEEADLSLELVGLYPKRDKLGKELTLCDKKALEVARALATNPKVLLLDECVAGLNIVETKRMVETIKNVRDVKGLTIVWIEHVMSAIMNVADRIVVISGGRKIADGTPVEVANSRSVIEAYLGEKYLFG